MPLFGVIASKISYLVITFDFLEFKDENFNGIGWGGFLFGTDDLGELFKISWILLGDWLGVFLFDLLFEALGVWLGLLPMLGVYLSDLCEGDGGTVSIGVGLFPVTALV